MTQPLLVQKVMVVLLSSPVTQFNSGRLNGEMVLLESSVEGVGAGAVAVVVLVTKGRVRGTRG